MHQTRLKPAGGHMIICVLVSLRVEVSAEGDY